MAGDLPAGILATDLGDAAGFTFDLPGDRVEGRRFVLTRAQLDVVMWFADAHVDEIVEIEDRGESHFIVRILDERGHSVDEWHVHPRY
jgi:hypothetical protein